jgi:ribonuclease P protein component
LSNASITAGRDFQRVYRSGKKVREDGLTIWAASRPDEGDTRLGMSIRAATGSAVERNRLRRRIREVFRAYDPAPGSDVVLSATREAVGRNFQELQDVLVAALERAGVGRRR